MTTNRTALKLGLQLVQIKLGQAAGDPGFSVFKQPPEAKKPAINKKNVGAYVEVPKITTTR